MLRRLIAVGHGKKGKMRKTFHDNYRVIVDGGMTYLLSHWITDLGIALCVSGPEVLLLHEHTVTEADGSELLLQPNSEPTPKSL
jgi:hypothetical protein